MPSELVQRLRNLHAHSGDPDTVMEAAQALENLEAQVGELSKDRASLIREADILREMLVERDAQLAEAVKVHMSLAREAAGTPLTDDQARKVLQAVMEVAP